MGHACGPCGGSLIVWFVLKPGGFDSGSDLRLIALVFSGVIGVPCRWFWACAKVPIF